MSEHKASIRWTRTTPDFTYDTYSRDHTVTFGGGVKIDASSAPEYKGTPTLPNPEEMLVAALSNCHMLTFLAIAAKKRLVLDAYEDDAVGVMTKNEKGKLYVSKVVLRPKVRFSSPVSAEVIAEMHHRSHEECFIASSVLTQVEVQS